MNWFRKFFCKHNFVVARNVYLPPVNKEVYGVSNDVILTLLYGKTTLTYRCPKCGKTYKEEFTGRM